jgi:cytoskeletal protein CcmA (bactofilin family)
MSSPEGTVTMSNEALGVGEVKRAADQEKAHIGRSVVIKGELDGSEDLVIDGHVEGKVELRDHTLTIGANGRVKAQVFAKAVIVIGELVGNVSATEKVDIRENGSVDGDLIAPRVAIAEGAHFRGSIDMQRKGGAPPAARGPVTAPSGTEPRSKPPAPAVSPPAAPPAGL